ncbi:MAG: DUF2157 domain-containing protein [Pseudomonadota bacterium]
MTSDREQFLAIVQRGDVLDAQLANALTEAGIAPSLARWRQFIDGLLLWLGASAAAAGVLFFFAYNWDGMDRLAKFALVQGLLIAVLAAYVWWRENPALGKALLFSASILTGVLLALFGQTYQTGVDPWQLFAMWAVMIVPWTVLSRFAPQWLLVLGLINVAVMLFWDAFRPALAHGLFSQFEVTLWSVLALNNGVALVLWEFCRPQYEWMQSEYARRIMALATGIPATIVAIIAVTFRFESASLIALFAWLALCAALYFFYRFRQADLFVVAGTCVSLALVFLVFVGDKVFSFRLDEGSLFILMAMLIVGLGTLVAIWIRRIQKAMLAEQA